MEVCGRVRTSFCFERSDGEIYDLAEENGYMAYKPDIELPIVRITRNSVLGRDSSLTYNFGTYDDRKIVVPILFTSWDKVKIFRRFFNGKTGKLYFNYKEGYYKITEVNSIFIRDAKGIPEIDINLTIAPFLYLEEEKIEISKPIRFYNDADIDSNCKIEIYGVGDFVLNINNNSYTIKGVEDYIVLNSETLQTYRTELENENEKVDGDLTMLKIKSEYNEVSWSGNVTKVVIKYAPILFE